jgi:protein-tyrosine phosphatase
MRYPQLTMIDIHCHILSGLDDGPESIETSWAMAEAAVEDGVTHIIATPHANSTYSFVPELIQRKRAEMQARFEGRLTFATGCDFHLSFENLEDVRENSSRFTLNQKNYLLVEFADFSIPASLDQALHNLQLDGLQPIVTHPERNPLIRSQPERLFRWIQQGCLVQVTAGSLSGRFGKLAQETSQRWLAAGAVHFIASDAHNMSSRPLRLKETFEWVSQMHGEEAARALMIENPRAAFEGTPPVYVPDVTEEDVVGKDGSSLKKRSWFFGSRRWPSA